MERYILLKSSFSGSAKSSASPSGTSAVSDVSAPLSGYVTYQPRTRG